MVKVDSTRQGFKEHAKRYEVEIILLIFLLLRFVFKNILGYKKYFTEQTIFGLSDKISIVIGTVVLLGICASLAMLFGKLIKRSDPSMEKPITYLVALFFACPVSLPFLFDSSSLSGTQMLYPFVLFILSVILANTRIFKWLIPFICATYFIPAAHTSEFFFLALLKGALLYVPLILAFLFLAMKKNQIEPGSNKKQQTASDSNPALLTAISLIVSVGSYIYTLIWNKSYNEIFYSFREKIDLYFLAGILIAAPALYGVCAVLYKAVKNKYPSNIVKVFAIAPLLLLLLSGNIYYSVWIPFLVISLFSLLFYSIWLSNPAVLSAVRDIGDYISEHRFFFYMVLIIMASFSNVTSAYLSKTFQNIFSVLPY